MTTFPKSVPQPQHFERREGHFDPKDQPWRLKQAQPNSAAIDFKLAALSALLGTRVETMASSEWCLELGAGAASLPAPVHSQAYSLAIEPAGLTLHGHDADGFFWGLVTLEQLLLGEEGVLPCVKIRDYPTIGVRYHHDDISRKQISTVADFKRIISHLSRFKINFYTLYIEDVLHLPHFPDIGEGRGKLMPDELALLHEEALKHNVEIFPSFSLAGHHENLLRLPMYAHLARPVSHQPSTLDGTRPEVREFLSRVLDDVCPQFPSRFFQMCFDEMQGVTRDGFLEHANWCAEQLVARGKTPLMWADMIYNHWGCEMLRELHPAIVPVNWNYERNPDGEIAHLREMQRHRNTWGLAGYMNWCQFLPNPEDGRNNVRAWVRSLQDEPNAALGCSLWGDDGYENSRDLIWNQIAEFGELAWTGAEADAPSFERRFQSVFYGAELPAIARILHTYPTQGLLGNEQIWKLHRKNPFALRRFMHQNPEVGARLDQMVALLETDLNAVESAQKNAKREAAHLDHLKVALLRTAQVVRRLQLARDCGVREADFARRVPQIVASIKQARNFYAEVWLRHNRLEGLEVSLGVFDRMAVFYQSLAREVETPYREPTGFQTINLNAHFNQCFLDCAGIPIGLAPVNGVPFAFADECKTHFRLEVGAPPLEIAIEPVRVADIHLIAAAPAPPDKKPAPALRVEILRQGQVILRDDLQSMRHLCDWWAPFGEHIWAGGGFQFVDPRRVREGLRPDAYFGLMHVFGCGLVGNPWVDAIRFSSLYSQPVELFAATLEVLSTRCSNTFSGWPEP